MPSSEARAREHRLLVLRRDADSGVAHRYLHETLLNQGEVRQVVKEVPLGLRRGGLDSDRGELDRRERAPAGFQMVLQALLAAVSCHVIPPLCRKRGSRGRMMLR
jgi:hypothetical protein